MEEEEMSGRCASSYVYTHQDDDDHRLSLNNVNIVGELTIDWVAPTKAAQREAAEQNNKGTSVGSTTEEVQEFQRKSWQYLACIDIKYKLAGSTVWQYILIFEWSKYCKLVCQCFIPRGLSIWNCSSSKTLSPLYLIVQHPSLDLTDNLLTATLSSLALWKPDMYPSWIPFRLDAALSNKLFSLRLAFEWRFRSLELTITITIFSRRWGNHSSVFVSRNNRY